MIASLDSNGQKIKRFDSLSQPKQKLFTFGKKVHYICCKNFVLVIR